MRAKLSFRSAWSFVALPVGLASVLKGMAGDVPATTAGASVPAEFRSSVRRCNDAGADSFLSRIVSILGCARPAKKWSSPYGEYLRVRLALPFLCFLLDGPIVLSAVLLLALSGSRRPLMCRPCLLHASEIPGCPVLPNQIHPCRLL